jgi:surface antigen
MCARYSTTSFLNGAAHSAAQSKEAMPTRSAPPSTAYKPLRSGGVIIPTHIAACLMKARYSTALPAMTRAYHSPESLTVRCWVA